VKSLLDRSNWLS